MTQDIIQEVKGSLDAIKQNAAQALEAFKTELAPKLHKLDAFDQKKFADIEKALADGVEATQKAEGARKADEDKIKALEAKQELLEKAFARPAAAGTADDAEKKAKADGKKLFNNFLRKGASSGVEDFADYMERSRVETDEVKALATKAMMVQSDPDGGYLVEPEFAGTIQTKVYETSPMRQLATVMQIGTDALEYALDDDEAEARWVGETEERPDTATPKVGQLLITAHELYAMPKATQKLIDDAKVNVESWLADKVAQTMARKENTAFMVGSGIGQPRGLFSYEAGTGNRQIEQVNSGSASALGYDGLITLMTSLKEEYQANASFLINRLGFAKLLLIKDLNGTPIFNMAYDRSGARPFTILGAPLNFASDLPTVAANALAAAYGDFKRAYVIVDRTGIRVLRDPYTSKPYVRFYTTKRVGGDVVVPEAVKILKIAA